MFRIIPVFQTSSTSARAIGTEETREIQTSVVSRVNGDHASSMAYDVSAATRTLRVLAAAPPEHSTFRADIKTVNAHQARYDHAYGTVLGVNKAELAGNIREKLKELYPVTASSNSLPTSQLLARAEQLSLPQSDLDRVQEKSVQPSMGFCLAHLSTLPKSYLDVFIHELAAIGGCENGRDNQVVFALFSTDSTFMFNHGLSFIPPRHGQLRKALYASFQLCLGKNQPESYQNLKHALQAKVVSGQSQNSNSPSTIQVNQAVFDAVFPEFATFSGYDLPELSDKTPIDEKLIIARERFRSGEPLAELSRAISPSIVSLLLNDATVAELVDHPDINSFINDYPERLGQQDSSSASIVDSLRYEDPRGMLVKLVPHLPVAVLEKAFKDKGVMKPLVHWAVEKGDIPLMASLHQRLGTICWENKDSRGNTPLMAAVSVRNQASIDWLVRQDVSINNEQNRDGKTVYALSVPQSGEDWSLTDHLIESTKKQAVKYHNFDGADLREVSVDGFKHIDHANFRFAILSNKQQDKFYGVSVIEHQPVRSVDCAERMLSRADVERIVQNAERNRERPNLHGVNLRGEDLRGAVLRGADLRGAVFTGADLRDAVLTGAVFTGADLRRADLEGAVLTGAVLRGADLRGAILEGAHLEGAVLSGAHLEGANLRGAYLVDADLHDAHLEGAVLTGANLRGAYLVYADLTGAVLTGADLRGAILHGAHLEGAHLEDADLRRAHLEDAH